MKTALILVTLAVVAAISTDASVLKAQPQSRANLIAGSISPDDTLLHRQYLYKAAIPNTIQSEDLIYRGNTTTRISTIYATDQDLRQRASAWIIAGGIGKNNATIRVQSYSGNGYYYLVDIYGR